jgi:hypothetical protein
MRVCVCMWRQWDAEREVVGGAGPRGKVMYVGVYMCTYVCMYVWFWLKCCFWLKHGATPAKTEPKA